MRSLFLETNFICTACDPLDSDYGTCWRILSLARDQRIDLFVPEMSFHESHHVLRSRLERRRGILNNLKELVQNGKEAKLSACLDFELDRFTMGFQSILNSLNPTEMLVEIRHIIQPVAPGTSFSATANAIRAAMTTGKEERPFLMTEIDYLVFSTVIDFCREHDTPVKDCLFCSRDVNMIDACETIQSITGFGIEVTDNFNAAFEWASDQMDWRKGRRRRESSEGVLN